MLSIAGALAVVLSQQPVVAQAVARLFGTTSTGLPIALKADNTGNLKVAIQSFVSAGFTGQLTGPTGCTSPAHSFTAETTSGLCLNATGDMRLRVAGTDRLSLDASNSDVKAPDGGAYLRVANGIVMVNSSTLQLGNAGSGKPFVSTTAVSSPTSCGTSPAVTVANGTASWVVTGGTGGTATGCTITMPGATTGWNCSIVNITAAAAHRAGVWTVQTASTTTSVTWEYQTVSTGAATAFTASDVFRGICFAY
jgi:hypothetical protein